MTQRNRPHRLLIDLLGDFHHDTAAADDDSQCLIDLRQTVCKLHFDYRSAHGTNATMLCYGSTDCNTRHVPAPSSSTAEPWPPPYGDLLLGFRVTPRSISLPESCA